MPKNSRPAAIKALARRFPTKARSRWWVSKISLPTQDRPVTLRINRDAVALLERNASKQEGE